MDRGVLALHARLPRLSPQVLHSSSRWAVEQEANRCSASVARYPRGREPGLFPCQGAGRPARTSHLADDETTSGQVARPHEQYHMFSIEEPLSRSALLERVSWTSSAYSACTQRPAAPQPVDGKVPSADNAESGSRTESLRLRQGIGANMSPFDPPHQ